MLPLLLTLSFHLLSGRRNKSSPCNIYTYICIAKDQNDFLLSWTFPTLELAHGLLMQVPLVSPFLFWKDEEVVLLKEACSYRETVSTRKVSQVF